MNYFAKSWMNYFAKTVYSMIYRNKNLPTSCVYRRFSQAKSEGAKMGTFEKCVWGMGRHGPLAPRFRRHCPPIHFSPLPSPSPILCPPLPFSFLPPKKEGFWGRYEPPVEVWGSSQPLNVFLDIYGLTWQHFLTPRLGSKLTSSMVFLGYDLSRQCHSVTHYFSVCRSILSKTDRCKALEWTQQNMVGTNGQLPSK